MPQSAKATLAGLLRTLRSNEKILLLGIAETEFNGLAHEMKSAFGFINELNIVEIPRPSTQARLDFFQSVQRALLMKPYEFINDLENLPKRKLKVLKPVQLTTDNLVMTKKKNKQQVYEDTKLKNILKLKLAAIMDLFKARYKKFKKPIIDDALLHHLFEPLVLQNPQIPYEVLYVKGEEPEHSETIKELSTEKYFYNMDLDTVEERIWNGFYSEAKQFLRDIRMIVKDAITLGDRERILKANEMFTNAQFGVDDFNNADFARACKSLREREVLKQKKLLADYHRLKEEFERKQEELLQNPEMMNLDNGEHQEVAPQIDGATNIEVIDSSDPTIAAEHPHEKTDSVDFDVSNKMDEDEKTGTDSNSNGKMAVELPCVSLTVAEDSVDAAPTADCEIEELSEVANASDSESEAEDGYHVDNDRELLVPSNVNTLFEDDMVSATNHFTLEELEYFVSRLMEIIWEDAVSGTNHPQLPN